MWQPSGRVPSISRKQELDFKSETFVRQSTCFFQFSSNNYHNNSLPALVNGLMSEKLQELLKLKSGGAYVPPAKLRALMAEVELEKNSEEFQKLDWEKLKKKINGAINKMNKGNLKTIVVDLFRLNLERGRGLLCTSLIRGQNLSNEFTDVCASLVCVINTKIPDIGELLINRLVTRYKRFFRREDKSGCRSSILFLAHLAIFHVCSYSLIMEIVDQLLKDPNDFTIERVVETLDTIGGLLADEEEVWFDRVKGILRNVLTENIVNPRSQFLIEGLFDKLRENRLGGSSIDSELDLVEEDDYVCHDFSLGSRTNTQDNLDIFHYEENYKENNEKYNELKHDILGSEDEHDTDENVDDIDVNSDFASDNDASDTGSDNAESDEESEQRVTVQIKDLTEQEQTNFQKNVYLTIMSSMGPEEAAHKLLKLPPIDPARKEYMLVDMVVKCCAQEKVYSKYYGIIGEILAVVSKKWKDSFYELFKDNYLNCHRYETSLLRNLGAFWGHMLASDKIGWECLEVVKLNENETTSSGRIFIKFVFQRLVEELGYTHLIERIEESYIQPFISGIFPHEDAEHMRFSINYFTAIGMGKLTDRMRETLEHLPVDVPAIDDMPADLSDSSRGRSSSRSSYSSRSSSFSRSRSRSRSASEAEGYPIHSNTKESTQERGRPRSRSASPSRREASFSRSRSGTPSGRASVSQHGDESEVNTNDRAETPTGPRGYNHDVYYDHRDGGRGRGRGNYRGGYRGTYRGNYRGRDRNGYRNNSTNNDYGRGGSNRGQGRGNYRAYNSSYDDRRFDNHRDEARR